MDRAAGRVQVWLDWTRWRLAALELDVAQARDELGLPGASDGLDHVRHRLDTAGSVVGRPGIRRVLPPLECHPAP